MYLVKIFNDDTCVDFLVDHVTPGSSGLSLTGLKYIKGMTTEKLGKLFSNTNVSLVMFFIGDSTEDDEATIAQVNFYRNFKIEPPHYMYFMTYSTDFVKDLGDNNLLFVVY